MKEKKKEKEKRGGDEHNDLQALGGNYVVSMGPLYIFLLKVDIFIFPILHL